MKKCQYSGGTCRAEELNKTINPKTVEILVKKYCLGDKEACSQYREIEDTGIGFGIDLANFLESGHNLFDSGYRIIERIKKKSKAMEV